MFDLFFKSRGDTIDVVSSTVDGVKCQFLKSAQRGHESEKFPYPTPIRALSNLVETTCNHAKNAESQAGVDGDPCLEFGHRSPNFQDPHEKPEASKIESVNECADNE